MRQLLFILVPMVTTGSAARAQQCALEWVSHPMTGANSNGPSGYNDISADGRLICFYSNASDLVLGDTNGVADIFLADRATGVISRCSVSSTGGQAQQECYSQAISGAGTCVVFVSGDPLLDPLNPANVPGIFARDLIAGTTRRVSVSSSGAAATGASYTPSISADGRFVAFTSIADNLVLGDTGQGTDIFVHDRVSGETRCATLDGLGVPANVPLQNPRISADGAQLVFCSADAAYIPNDLNGFRDVYMRDLVTGAVQLMSAGPGGVPANGDCFMGSLSGDGRTLVFDSGASNLVPGDFNAVADVFTRDVQSGAITRMSVGPQGQETSYVSSGSEISSDGRFVTFSSQATGWFLGTTVGTAQVCVRDRLLGTIELVSKSAMGQPSNASALWPRISGNGSTISFICHAGNLTPPQAGYWPQTLVRTCSFPTGAVSYCVAKVNSLGCTPQIASQGASSASQASGFEIRCSNVRNQKLGLLLYAFAGRASIPFQNGTLCLNPPLRRGPAQSSAGSPLPMSNCSGSYVLDMNAYAAAIPVTSPARMLAWPGSKVQAQWWGRDPGFPAPNGTMLSNALEYFVGP